MTKVLITGIGGSIGIDVARSLRRAGGVKLVGCDSNPWGRKLGKRLVDEIRPLPRADQDPAGFVAQLSEAITATGADFAFVNPDAELEALAQVGVPLPCPVSAPTLETVGICLDKGRTVERAKAVSDAFPRTIAIEASEDPAQVFRELAPPLWMRCAVGAGGKGSLSVDTPDEARAWMAYWGRRGRDSTWLFQELLPGRNLNWTGIYVSGELVASAAMERLHYFLGGAAPSGVSGQVSECRTVDPRELQPSSDRVVRALDEVPHGIYSVDLRLDRTGQPRVTEVNPRLAGRPWLYTHAGANVALAALRALTGQPVGDAIAPGGLVVGMHLYRQLDIEPEVGFLEDAAK